MQELLTQEKIGLTDMQQFHVWLDELKQFDQAIMPNLAYLAGEVGEVINAVRDFERLGKDEPSNAARDHIAEELADCLAYICKLANYMQVDLQAAYVGKMERNIGRSWKVAK